MHLGTETNFRLLFESIPGLNLALLPDFSIVAVSDEYLKITSTKRVDILGCNLLKIFPQQLLHIDTSFPDQLKSSLNFVLTKKVAHRMDMQQVVLNNPDGNKEKKYLSHQNKPILDINNKMIYIIHSISDVTDFVEPGKFTGNHKNGLAHTETNSFIDRHQITSYPDKDAPTTASKKHAVAKDGILNLAEITNLQDCKRALDISSMVFISNHHGDILEVNQNFCNISGYKKQELLQEGLDILESGYQSKKVKSTIQKNISGGNIWKGENRYKAKNGSYFWVDTTIVPFNNEPGKTYKYLHVHFDISGFKKNIFKLKASEENFRGIFENSLIAMHVTDLQTGKKLKANEACIKLLGYHSEQELVGNFEFANHFLDIAAHTRMLNRLKLKGEVVNMLLELKKTDGTIFWTKVFIKSNHEKTIAHTIMLDMSQQMEDEKMLIEREGKYKDIFENSLVGIFSYDLRNSKMIDVNNKGVALLEYPSKEDFLENFKPEDHYMNPDERLALLEKVCKIGEIENASVEMKKLDGSPFWATLFLKFNSTNNILQTVILDSTSNVNALEQLKRSEERFMQSFHASPIALSISEINSYKYLDVNERFLEIFECSREDVLGKNAFEAGLTTAMDFKNIEWFLAQNGSIRNYSISVVSKSGKTKRILLSIVPIGEKSKEQFWLASFFENTESYELKIKLEESNLDLENRINERTMELSKSLRREREVNEMKSRFVSFVSHEFRTPLAGIQSSAYIIQLYKEAADQGKRLRHIDQINSNINELTTILNNFLSFTKIENGNADMRIVNFNLFEFLTMVAEEVKEMLGKKNQHIHYQHTGEQKIELSSEILKNLLLNLLSNASKYSPDNRQIKLRSAVTKKLITITVEDKGIGITAEDQQKMFVEFFRAKEVENIQGSGLGLIIVKKYVELLNGKIKFKSKTGKGTTITVQFPKYGAAPTN